MSNPTPASYTAARVSEIREDLKDCASISEALTRLVKLTGHHRDSCRRLNRRYRFWGRDGTRAPVQDTTTSTRPQGDTQVDALTPAPAALEDVIKMCHIDEAKWEVKSFGVGQRKQGFAWRVSLSKRPEPIDVESMLSDFVARAEAYAPRVWKVAPLPTKVKTNRLLEIACFDVHVGRLCWGKETGHPDYDIHIAPDLVKAAVENLTQAASGMGIGRVLLPIGNDLLNSEASGSTTAGTPQSQSEDSRWKKKFTVACDLMVDTIERLASLYPVDVLVVSGNHDREGSFYLGQYVRSYFRNHPNVTVNNEPTQRKYYRFGSTLLGFTHGNEEKVANLPGIMAVERPLDWGQTRHREWHTAHEHRESVVDLTGCKVRHIPSLTPPDDWMASKGYVGHPQSAQAFVIDDESGLVASLYYTV